MKNILAIFTIAYFILLASCSSPIKPEKDNHPEIPEFPLFAKDSLKYKVLDVATVTYTAYKSAKVDGHNMVIHINDFFYYTIADSALFVITGYSESIKPGNPHPAKNFVELRKISNNKIEKIAWIDTCETDLQTYSNGTELQIGNKFFNVKSPKLTFAKSNKTDAMAHDSLAFSSASFSYYPTDKEDIMYDTTMVKEFDRIIAGSKGNLSGGLNNLDYTYKPVPMVYYQFKVNGKTGKTKINFDMQKTPLLLKVNQNLYSITYGLDLLGVSKHRIKYEIAKIE